MSVRTVTLPTQVGASWDDFAWPSKAPSDDLDYTLDLADWLADSGLILDTASVSASAGLSIVDQNYGVTGNHRTSVVLQITNGAPGTTAQVALRLQFEGGHELDVLIALPIRLALPDGLIPFVPDTTSALAVGGEIITIGGELLHVLSGTVPDTTLALAVGGQVITIGGEQLDILAGTTPDGTIGVGGSAITIGGQSILV